MYEILSIVMLFALAYGILVKIVDPENSKSGVDGKKILQKLVMAIVLLALIPSIFSFMFGLQEAILESNVLNSIFTGSSNVGGFAGSIYNGSVNESASTSDISIGKSSINAIKLNVGGFVGNIDITNDTIDKSYLDKTSYRSVKISNSYATNDIDLGNMFKDTTKHKAGLFIGSISTNDTDKTNRTIN